MDMKETFLRRTQIFDGHVVHLFVDDVRLPNGDTAQREIVTHGGGACVAALTRQNELLLVRQFRYAFGEVLLEIPAGKLERGEDPFEAMKREQREETGTHADRYVSLGVTYPTVGYDDEKIYIWACRVTEPAGDQHLDPDEFLEVEKLDLWEAERMVLADQIRDGKTQIAILKTAALVRAGQL
ncbi:MAG: NUDIX hydrolase [Clostridiales bacterium]|nr:NUDIX hydrolase [Clostridiales bacterium]MCD8368156.1 NUDIX hydrolase [Clostridiales bacterium]